MHILIATAGVLPPAPVADLAHRFIQGDGDVTVLTVIEVPRSFLDSLSDEEWRPFESDPAARADEREKAVARYVEERGKRWAEPVLAALRSRGIAASALHLEGEAPAKAIVATSAEMGADLIIMGATKPLFAEAAWGSVSAEVMQRTQCPLLLVPGVKAGEEGGDEIDRGADEEHELR